MLLLSTLLSRKLSRHALLPSDLARSPGCSPLPSPPPSPPTLTAHPHRSPSPLTLTAHPHRSPITLTHTHTLTLNPQPSPSPSAQAGTQASHRPSPCPRPAGLRTARSDRFGCLLDHPPLPSSYESPRGRCQELRRDQVRKGPDPCTVTRQRAPGPTDTAPGGQGQRGRGLRDGLDDLLLDGRHELLGHRP